MADDQGDGAPSVSRRSGPGTTLITSLAALWAFLDGKPVYLPVDDEILAIDSLIALRTTELERDPTTFRRVVTVLIRSHGGNWSLARPDYVERYALLRRFAERVRSESRNSYVRNVAGNLLFNTGSPD